jgi:DNA-binding MarR family transcriptional regulator
MMQNPAMPKKLLEFEGRLFYRVKHLTSVMRSAADTSLRRIGLSGAQYTALAALEASPGASNAALARLCFVTPQTANEVSRGLESAKLVERGETAQDRREIALHLTDEGRRLLAAGHEKMREVEEAALLGVPGGKQQAFLRYLDAMAATVEAGQGDEPTVGKSGRSGPRGSASPRKRGA